jgi:hypothetical protein
MVHVDFDAVVEPVPMPSEGIEQKIGPLVPPDAVFLFQNRQEIILKLRRAVRKV